MRKFHILILKWDFFSNPFPQGLGIYMEAEAERFKESEVMDYFKHPTSFRHNRADELIETMTACTNIHKFKSHKIPVIEKRK